ncbi:MAG TPA: aminotransferase class IV [Steroidobacteraceae bacterium]|nr:aminotransferase class IV [Steroidobacteraceae bacterium]
MAEPLSICHLDGALLPLREARISPLDRSFLFGDGVYEVIPARRGNPRHLAANLARLSRSMAELRIANPHSDRHWSALVHELISANGGGDVYVYLQVSRGAEYGRNHAPLPQVAPLVFAFCAPLPLPSAEVLENGVSCITAPDIRWARCDIKSVALLANVLLRQQAIDANAGETILLRDGQLTEASASSVCVIIDGQIRCPPESPRLLPGTTRALIGELAAVHGIPCHEVPVSERELRTAAEIWLTAATRGAVAVTRLDGLPVGDGRPGPLWRCMHALLEAWWLSPS